MGKRCTMLFYLRRFNKISVTLYIVHMELFFFIYFVYRSLSRCFAGNQFFLFIEGVPFHFFFSKIEFYLWRVI